MLTILTTALAFLSTAVSLAAAPWALVGYLGLGVYSQRPWQAAKYGLLWGLAVQIFALALGRIPLSNLTQMAVSTVLRVLGAIVITVAIFYLARYLRRPKRA